MEEEIRGRGQNIIVKQLDMMMDKVSSMTDNQKKVKLWLSLKSGRSSKKGALPLEQDEACNN